MVSRTVLVARLDSAGDVLLQGPMVRAVAASADRVVFLAGPQGAEAAALLTSVDYPGSLLDVRHRVSDDLPEPERALSLAAAAGFALPEGDDGRLAVRRPLPPVEQEPGYVVLHPGASVP